MGIHPTIEYETFRTKREAVAWMKQMNREKGHSYREVIPIDKVEDSVKRENRKAKGHRWAMRWWAKRESSRIPGLN